MSHTSELIEIDGSCITESDIKQSMRVNILAGFFGMVWCGMTLNYSITLFMDAIGASGMAIGLLMTIRQMAISVQIPSALVFENLPEHLGSRKRYWSTWVLVYRFSWFLLAALALFWKPGAAWFTTTVIVTVGLGEFLAQISNPPWYSWMADLVPYKTAGAFWGRRQSITTVGALLGMLLAGQLLDFFVTPGTRNTSPLGFALVFGIGAIFGISDIIIHLRVKEPRRSPTVRGDGFFKRLITPLRNADFVKLTLCMGAISAAYAFGPFGIIYLKRYFPIAYSQIALLGIAGSLGAVSASVIIGKLIDRYGARFMCAVLLTLVPLTACTWFFINRSFIPIHLPWGGVLYIPQVLMVHMCGSFVGGALCSGISLCQLRLMALLSSASGRTMAMAVHWCVIGLVSSLGSLLGGYIMDWFTAHPWNWLLPTGTDTYFGFYHVCIVAFMTLFWCISLPLMLSIKAPVDKVRFGDAVWWIINPFNIIRSLGSLRLPHILDDQESAEENAQAREAGEKR